MHGPVPLAGPLWLVAQIIVVAAIVASAFMLFDSVRAVRREGAGWGLWVYRVFSAAFLALLVAVQVIPGVQLGAAAVAIAAPLMVVMGLVYLLRVVFPKQPAGE